MLPIVFLLFLVPFCFECSCPSFISRSEWRATLPKHTSNLKVNPPSYVVIHHTDTPPCNTFQACKNQVKSIQNYHQKTKNWDDIGYNFLIGGDGKIYEGRGWGLSGAHLPNYNSKSIGISLMGKFHDKKPSTAQLNALKQLIRCAEETAHVSSDYKLIGHRQGKSTTCPGDKLFEEISTYPHFDSNQKP